jgi:hypothetical protein
MIAASVRSVDAGHARAVIAATIPMAPSTTRNQRRLGTRKEIAVSPMPNSRTARRRTPRPPTPS